MARKWIDVTGKTEEAAISKGLVDLGLSRDDVSVEILERPKKGILGIGARPAKVRISYGLEEMEILGASVMAAGKKSGAPETPGMPEMTETPGMPETQEMPETPETPGTPGMPETPGMLETPGMPEAEQDAPSESGQESKPEEPVIRFIPFPPAKPVEKKKREKKMPPPPPPKKMPPERREELVPPPENLGEPCTDENAQAIATFLNGLLLRMGSGATAVVYQPDSDRYKVIIEGEKLGSIIGHRGETLDAIQLLTVYSVNQRLEQRVRIQVDAENYRWKREQSLSRLALKVAGKVVRTRRNVTLEPMNAYERHVIHEALQDVPHISTHSTGNEPNRRIIVSYTREKEEPNRRITVSCEEDKDPS